MANDSILSPCPTVYYVYALLDPRTESIYYVGQTTNIVDRLYAHKYNGSKSKLSIPVYARTKEILKSGELPQLIVLDTVETYHLEIALRLEECWRVHMLNENEILSNAWKTGRCIDTDNPMAEAEYVKGYALATVEQIDELRELDKVRALQKVFG